MPRVCPNCLRPAEFDARYCYTHQFPLFLLDRTQYWQTFYYCGGCMEQLEAYFGSEKWKGRLIVLGILGLFGAMFAGVLLVDTLRPPEGEPASDLVGWLGLAPLIAWIAGWWLLNRAIQRTYERRQPRHAHQAAWGPAAFYVGDGALGFGHPQTRVYRAARREWLQELVRANPDQIDEAQYQSIVGEAKPAEVPVKPFAG